MWTAILAIEEKVTRKKNQAFTGIGTYVSQILVSYPDLSRSNAVISVAVTR